MKKIFTLFAALAMVMSMSAVNMTGGEELYLTPNSNWLQHGDGKAPRFAIYVYGSGGNAWASMTAVEGESNLYKAVVPNGNWTNVIFCRMNGGKAANDWGNRYNQTGDLTYNGTQNWYTVKEGTWDNGGGTWALYAPEAPKSYKDITITIVANATPKIHYWDGGDKMVGTVWENLPEMTATSEANTYSCTIKDVDEAIGVKYLIKVGEVQSADQQAFNDVKVNFKDLLPQVVVQGVNNWDGTDKMTVADDYLSASITLPLIAKKYDLKLTIDGAWKGHKNENNITRAKNSSVFKNDDGNGSITADIAGDYVFTYTYANQTLTVTYPALPVKYNVTVTAENGTVTGAGEYEEGKEATLTATPAEGYEFVNWTKGEEVVSTENPYKFTVTADVALVANFIKKTISYEMNGGAFPEVKVPTNEELALVFKQEYAEYFAIEGLTDTDMKREVGNFIYVTNSKGGDAIKFITENANWKWLHDYILTVAGNIPEGTNVGYYWRANLDGFFHCKNAVAVGGVASADYTVAGKPEAWGAAYQAAHAVVLPTEPVDAPYTLPTPVKEGYKFVGWYDNAEGTGEPMTVIPAGWDGTLYAIWVEIYTITVKAENGTVEGAGNYEHGAEATLTATAAEGYEFTCWTSGEDTVSTANPYKFTVTADVALVANFKKSFVTHDFYVEDVNVTKTEWSIDLAGSWNEQAFVLKLWQDNTQGFGTYAANAETGYSAVLGVKELTPTAEGYYMQDPMNKNAFIFQGTMTDGADIYEVYLKGALASESETGEMEAKTEVTFSCDADGVWSIEAFADDYSWGLTLEVVPNLETGEYVATGYYVTDIEAGVTEEVAGTGMLYFDDFSGCQVFKGNLTTESGNIYPTLYASSLDLITNEIMTGPSWIGEIAGVDYYEVLLMANNNLWELDLHARNCTGDSGTYTVDIVDVEEGAYSTFMGTSAVTGELTINEDNSYEAYVTTVDADGNPAMSISLSAWEAEAAEYDVVITNATVTENTSGYYIDMTGEWDGHTIKVEVCDELDTETIRANFFIDGGIANDGDQAEGTVEATVNEGVVTITGTFECLGSGAVYNVTISGTLPGGTTTSLDNLNTNVAPVKMIENGQLIIVKDGVQYNAQGAVIK